MIFQKSHLILIIDAQETEFKVLSKFLENFCCKLAIATDKQESMKLAIDLMPSLILMDMSMAKKDNFAVYKFLQSSTITQEIPIIFMAELDDIETLAHGIELGAVDCLIKPLKKEEVLNRIQLHLRLHLLNMKLQQHNQLLIQESKFRTTAESELRQLTQELESRVEERGTQLFIALQELQKAKQELFTQEAKLRYDRLHDSITGLPNRAWLMEELQTIMQFKNQRPNFQYAVLSIDIDRFKVVNDSLGYIVGDELLKSVACRLQWCLRHGGKIARFGGDEFIVILEDIELVEQVTVLAEGMLDSFKLPFQINGYEVFAGVSIGITLSTMGYQSPIEALRDAGIAMSQAKQAGKGRYAVLNPESKAKAIARLQLETDLRQAIEREEFYLEYQPIYCLSNGKLQGFEALVRWNHPSRGHISPVDFIPTAEEIGLIDRLGFWVLQEAVRQLRDWQQEFPQYPGLVMNVNLSAKQLKQAKLLKQIETILGDIGLARNSLKLEITESWFLEISTEEIDILQELRDRGIGLCIDDFGTGYSSLSRLHLFPVDTIRIDRCFVKRLGTGIGETEIVQTIVSLAHSLGLELVAEGIETTEQLHKLQELGYEFGQGFIFSRPLSSKMARQLLHSLV